MKILTFGFRSAFSIREICCLSFHFSPSLKPESSAVKFSQGVGKTIHKPEKSNARACFLVVFPAGRTR
jgi:hypothetical protein